MQEIFDALDLTPDFDTQNTGSLRSRFAVSDIAENALGAVGCALADLVSTLNLTAATPQPLVDRRLASLWFAISIEPLGWKLPPTWDAIAGDYETLDGWIKLHTNLPHHRKAACKALGLKADTAQRSTVASAISTRSKDELEFAIVDAHGVAAAMRTLSQWADHDQGAAVARAPLINWEAPRRLSKKDWRAEPQRPLSGLRVLDLTRVLAGPVATRTLAAFGASVLRIDPPGWDEQIVIPEVTLGKHCARLDLRTEHGKKIIKELLADTDILVHGYRPGALDGLGLGQDQRRAIAPDLIDVCLNAYGWTGPWSGRRGFDSLVQMSSGIAHAGMEWAGADETGAFKPTPLPVQALDFATGYLMAAATLKLLSARAKGLPVADAKLSLARTAHLLSRHENPDDISLHDAITNPHEDDWAPDHENTMWGPARRLKPPLTVGNIHMQWSRPAGRLGTSAPEWPSL